MFSENELLQILQQFRLVTRKHAFRTGKDHGIGFDWFVFEFEGEGVDLFVVSFLYFTTNINIYLGGSDADTRFNWLCFHKLKGWGA